MLIEIDCTNIHCDNGLVKNKFGYDDKSEEEIVCIVCKGTGKLKACIHVSKVEPDDESSGS